MLAIVDADSCIYQAAWQQETLESALENYKAILHKNWIDPLWADETVIYCAGKDNFRYSLCPQYKANRKDPHKDASLFKPLTQHIIEEGLAIPSHGMEADDMVRIKAVECAANNQEFIVVHIDKDLDCIPGQHYNPRRSEFYEITEDTADLKYWLQMLKGDPTDNLPGLPKIGPKKAEKMLDGVPMERRKKRVVAAYRAKYGIVNWKEKLLETANGIHILRSHDDYFAI
jgi:5'-3' exonuclease